MTKPSPSPNPVHHDVSPDSQGFVTHQDLGKLRNDLIDLQSKVKTLEEKVELLSK